MVSFSILSISVESTEDDDIPALQIIRRLWSISACFLWGIGHSIYRESLGTTINNDVSHSLASMLQEHHRRHVNLHVHKCFGMGTCVFSVGIVNMGLWR